MFDFLKLLKTNGITAVLKKQLFFSTDICKNVALFSTGQKPLNSSI